jgi:hypothetical protein
MQDFSSALVTFPSGSSALGLPLPLDSRGSIHVFIRVTAGKGVAGGIRDVLIPEPRPSYPFDRACVDLRRLDQVRKARTVFVTRTKRSLRWQRRRSHPVDRTTGFTRDP